MQSDVNGEDAALKKAVGDALWNWVEDADLDSATADALDAVPDGWAKVDGEWIRITADGVGYGEFDREHSGRNGQP